ncbi:GTP cyclohydrolase II [Wenzhouxiangella marina]|uniref:GTP cyclohydrolase-2 n=1 Tax=Wenzhouxiangella marina TaxID=1579979 RepID=A0A0K0Y0B0_9GAMM|nr:GTP cyclohydrolase II [Wenzhouxiangella marina]AKS43301.1 GTP cyclohydrolase [Wenzhouxiangella marina]MBB6087008.1 GTP cyclohydrolase II [Wenzhouxiangella marina]
MTHDSEIAMHQVERALFDLRRGVPVLVIDESAGEAALVFPIESISHERLDALVEQAGSTPALTLTAHRLAAMGLDGQESAASLSLQPGQSMSIEAIYETAAGATTVPPDGFAAPGPASRSERAGLALLRRALLVPAAVTVTVAPERQTTIEAAVARGELLAVPARLAERCFELGRGMLKRISEADVPLREAEQARFVLFREPDGLREHLAVLIGEREDWPESVPVRLHSSCLTGDLFASLRCDCGEQLTRAVSTIREMGGGVLLYLAQEGRGIGLANKLRAYAIQDQGHDTVEADQRLGFGDDERRYGVAVDMLRALDIARIHLLTNNPAKLVALANGGIEVNDNGRLFGRVTQQNRRYLSAKARRSGHLLQELLGES